MLNNKIPQQIETKQYYEPVSLIKQTERVLLDKQQPVSLLKQHSESLPIINIQHTTTEPPMVMEFPEIKSS